MTSAPRPTEEYWFERVLKSSCCFKRNHHHTENNVLFWYHDLTMISYTLWLNIFSKTFKAQTIIYKYEISLPALKFSFWSCLVLNIFYCGLSHQMRREWPTDDLEADDNLDSVMQTGKESIIPIWAFVQMISSAFIFKR